MNDDIEEHRHTGYEYWHPVTRKHAYGTPLPEGHVGNKEPDPEVDLETQEQEAEEQLVFQKKGLPVKKFDWASWDNGCHAKGICQGYHSIPVIATDCATHDRGNPCPGWSERSQSCIHAGKPCAENELHHRNIDPKMIGIAEPYWQCPHCQQIQQPIQRAQGARLESYCIETRGNRIVLWVSTANQHFVLITHGTVQAVANGHCEGTAYAVGFCPPLQLPDEVAVILARRFWYRLTKGFWSNKDEEDLN